jgi:hypothetical protein
MSDFSTHSTGSTGIGHLSSQRGYSPSVADRDRLAEPAAALVEIATLYCIECERPWLAASERWRLKVSDDEIPETVPYCPDCAYREFGPSL